MIWIVVLISILYNAYILRKYGLPESLSETSYLLGKDKWLFVGYCVLTGGLLLPLLLNATPVNYQFLAFFMCAGLIFAGSSPLYRNGLDKYVHYVSAILAFIAFIIWIGLHGLRYPIFFAISLLYFYLGDKKYVVYFAEILALIYIIFMLLFG